MRLLDEEISYNLDRHTRLSYLVNNKVLCRIGIRSLISWISDGAAEIVILRAVDPIQ